MYSFLGCTGVISSLFFFLFFFFHDIRSSGFVLLLYSLKKCFAFPFILSIYVCANIIRKVSYSLKHYARSA